MDHEIAALPVERYFLSEHLLGLVTFIRVSEVAFWQNTEILSGQP